MPALRTASAFDGVLSVRGVSSGRFIGAPLYQHEAQFAGPSQAVVSTR